MLHDQARPSFVATLVQRAITASYGSSQLPKCYTCRFLWISQPPFLALPEPPSLPRVKALALIKRVKLPVPLRQQAFTMTSPAVAPRFQNLTGQTSCPATPAGFYNDVTGASAPIPCTAGHFQNLTGQTSCQNTPAGSYNDGNANGSPSPVPCPAGKYQPTAGQGSCLPAPLGFSTRNVAGSTSVIACSAGQFQNRQISCQPTPAGFYNNGTSYGSPSPVPCDPGSYQPYTGKNFCYGAPKGRFQSMQAFAAPAADGNVSPVNCTGSIPNTYPASGDGCIASKTDCIHTAACAQDPVIGACTAGIFYG
ncbi:hypothetical protein B0H17DRAFT_1194182 [Mycena rosella]|uniref:Tyrosine-protein kinase ephrin type A/B receptor-like domain-containing protein n=1 Tax=Mycena rosella TaxID=1033263 RepID=A0AAD7GRK7_MYCRO|nr:hypothetical protein B0H17DRAFT_1194182 [Mycena rosella]